jgi:hypothetical protein
VKRRVSLNLDRSMGTDLRETALRADASYLADAVGVCLMIALSPPSWARQLVETVATEGPVPTVV